MFFHGIQLSKRGDIFFEDVREVRIRGECGLLPKETDEKTSRVLVVRKEAHAPTL